MDAASSPLEHWLLRLGAAGTGLGITWAVARWLLWPRFLSTMQMVITPVTQRLDALETRATEAGVRLDRHEDDRVRLERRIEQHDHLVRDIPVMRETLETIKDTVARSAESQERMAREMGEVSGTLKALLRGRDGQ